MFGLNIECNFREDYREIDDEMIISGETGDGSIDIAMTDLRTNSPIKPDIKVGGKNE